MDFTEKLGIGATDLRLIFGRTKVDYDKDKETENRKKHGYSLESAVHYFENQLLPFISSPFISSSSFKENNEVRHMHMGLDSSGDVVLFVTTMRDDETIRIISFRRASNKECKLFEEHTGYVKSNT